MKSKIIFTLILFSLLLNIFHDLLIEQQVQTEVMTMVMDKSQQVQDKLCDLHEVFHFTAILPFFEPLQSSLKVLRKPTFTQTISSYNILERSFKPPRA